MSTRDAPVSQCVSPRASRLTVFRTHVLMTAAMLFGMGSGAPKLQPALVQLLRPVSGWRDALRSRWSPAQQSTFMTSGLTESGEMAGSVTAEPPPPKYSPLHASVPPPVREPQSPVAKVFRTATCVGTLAPQVHAARDAFRRMRVS